MRKNIYYSLILLSLLVAFSGCKKGFLTDLAQNPNSPSGADPSLVLPGVLSTLSANISGGGTYQRQGVWLGYWNYSGGYSLNADVQGYKMTTDTPQVWDNYYGILSNANYVEQTSASMPNMQNFMAIAKIIKALCFQYLVDVYNDVPYTQALKGTADLFPQYDKGSDIYDSLVNQLDEAISLIQNSPNAINPGSSDIMYNGKMNLWLKFANTVKLRLLLRESNVSSKQSFIQSEIAKTANVGYIGFGEDALVNPGYLNSSGKQNPIWASYALTPSGSLVADGYNYLRGGKAAMDFYKLNNDPRLAYFYGQIGDDPRDPNFFKPTLPVDTSKYAADPLGEQTLQPSKGSGLGPGVLKGYNAPSVIMLAAESYFVQAEAVVRGYMSGDAQTLYQNGIKASFEYLNVGGQQSVADNLAQTYYSQNLPNVGWNASTDKIKAIITQKWAALNGICNVEAWNDWRRTGYPVVPISVYSGKVADHMPYRYYYPTSEYQRNVDALKAVGGDQVDPYNDKIFWGQ
ncbi:MAG: SusD/RagB family nutrient-binding outer membrane lipoprotein [Thermoflavifilum sp.]|nr:SusD/RagB family nutrient-binding outer membrane lipoprotein [Thermoflavifilum sp.]